MDQSIKGDELFAYDEVFNRRFFDSIDAVKNSIEVTPPFFFVLAWFSIKLGDPTIWIRFPSLVFGTALIPLVYLLGRRTVGERGGVIGAGVVAFAPFAVTYSTEARPYATLMFMSAASTYCLLKAVEAGPGWGWWAAYSVVSAAVLYTHYTGVYALGVQILWVLWRHRSQVRALVFANLGTALLFAPWLPNLRNKGQLDNPFFVTTLNVDHVWRTLTQVLPGRPDFTLDEIPGTVPVVVFVAALIAGIGVALYRLRRRPGPDGPPREGLSLLVMLSVAAPIGVLAFSLIAGYNIFHPRYLAASFPAAVLCVAALAAGAGRRGGLIAGALLIGALALGGYTTVLKRSQALDFRSAAHYIDDVASPGDVVVEQPGNSKPPQSQALRINFRKPHDVVPVDGAHRVGTGYEANVDPTVWNRTRSGGKVYVVGPELQPYYRLPRPPTKFKQDARLLTHKIYKGKSDLDLFVYGPR